MDQGGPLHAVTRQATPRIWGAKLLSENSTSRRARNCSFSNKYTLSPYSKPCTTLKTKDKAVNKSEMKENAAFMELTVLWIILILYEIDLP